MKVDLNGAWVTMATIGFGITIYAAFCRAYPGPIGFAWGVEFGGKKRSFQVYDSYIVDWARRSGVRTLINSEILKRNDCIITGGRSKSGIAFMKARGYRYDAALDQWSLTAAPLAKARARRVV